MNAPQRIEDFSPFGDEYGPLLQGPYAPISDESELIDLPLIQGAIPKDLNGVYMRAGPNPRFAPNGRYHPFDGG
jgi:carotenoid cleavage dioxygenase-like enzyme